MAPAVARSAAGWTCAPWEKQRLPYKGALRLGQGKTEGGRAGRHRYGGGQAGRSVLPARACLRTRCGQARITDSAAPRRACCLRGPRPREGAASGNASRLGARAGGAARATSRRARCDVDRLNHFPVSLFEHA
jgi:hypothetical protein